MGETKEQVVAEPVKKEEKNVKETPADQVKKELNKKLEERKAVKQEIPDVQEKKEQPVENNQDQ